MKSKVMNELNNKVIEEKVREYLSGELSEYNFKLFWKIVCVTADFDPEQSTAFWKKTVRNISEKRKEQTEFDFNQENVA